MISYFELSFGVEEELLAGIPESSESSYDLADILGHLVHKDFHFITEFLYFRVEGSGFRYFFIVFYLFL